MRRRELLKYAGATALAAPFIRTARADTGTVKIGVVGAKTGPLAPGAAATFFPPWQLWAHQVNQAGGLKLKSGQRKVELIEYDDHTQPPEAIKAIERLASIDKADWVVGLYSTGFNVAAVPTFAKLGYPQLAVACVTDLGPQLVKKNPRLFFANGTTTQYSSAVVDVLKKLQSSGRMGNKIAMVNVADEYGIESANISRKLFPAAGFRIGLRQILSAWHAGLRARDQSREGCEPGRLYCLFLSARHLRFDRSSQNRKLQREGLLQRHRVRVRRFCREIRRGSGERHRLRRRS